MFSLAPLLSRTQKLAGRPLPDITQRARDTWVIAAAEKRYIAPAVCLAGQLEKIRATEFASHEEVLHTFRGGFETVEPPTVGYRLRNVDLFDGVIYGDGTERHLRSRKGRALFHRAPKEVMSGALFESWLGNRWFGNWLSDDCLTYTLAAEEGTAVTTRQSHSGHVPEYQQLLEMTPRRVSFVRFDELLVFDDTANNILKATRAETMRDAILKGLSLKPCPGVFLLRGASGDARVLENELDIAERLSTTYGFKILDPSQQTVSEIAQAAGEAAIVAGVEGSHLVHGLVAMPKNAALLAIQPPDRTVAALKLLTDRRSQRYAFVMAEGTNESFRVNWDDLRRTIDLLR